MKNDHWLIYALAGCKLLIHFFTNTNYGLHRDEYLYFDMGFHLGWGYLEVPPMIAILSKMAYLLGGSVFAIRLFPALIGAITVVLIGHLVKSLGGKTGAVLIAGAAFILSPAYLGSNTLFQPVSFNQFCWFLGAYLVVKIVQTQETRYWYYLGIAAGLAFLTKYSIVFYMAALILALLISQHRKVFLTKYPYIAALIALVIALPNLIWQYQLGFPVINHMEELARTQLVNVRWLDFFKAQFLMQSSVNLIWIAGALYLFLDKKYRDYRFITYALAITVGLIISLSGKDYYTLGAYPMLFVFGGLAWNQWLKPVWAKAVLIIVLFLINFPLYPYVLPVLKVDKMETYCAMMKDRYGLDAPLVWEDGKMYTIPQDYADMHGWDEMARKVIDLYLSLPEEDQKACMLYGGSYGHAGAINYFGRELGLPEAFSFNSSYKLWLREDYSFSKQIQVEDNKQGPSQYFETMILVDSTENRLARDPGYIYFKEAPKIDVEAAWKGLVKEIKAGI